MQTILQFLGLFLVLILSFFGSNYMLNGDVIVSGSLSLGLVILFYFLLEFLKKRKVQITKRKFSVVSILLWSIFAALSIPTSMLVIHALNVELNAKRDLQAYSKAVVNKNQEVVNLFQSENQKYIAETHLIVRNALDTYVNTSNQLKRDSIKRVLGDPRFGITDFTNINKTNFTNSATALQSALEIRSQAVLDSVLERSKLVLNSSSYLVENWSRLRVVGAITELENMLEKNINQLNRFLVDENYKQNVFVTGNELNGADLSILITENKQLSITKSAIQLSSLSGLWSAYKPYWLLIPVLILLFLLLLPYLLEKTAGVYINLDPNDTEESDEGGIEI
jgi:hypothetical protein